MLQNIRNNIQGMMAKIIIGIIIVPFAIFGVDSLVGGSSSVNVAEVNGVDVTDQELQQAIMMQKRRLMNMMGENADPSMFDDNMLRTPALEQLIQKKLLLQAADDASIDISPQALNQSIASMPEFQENGKFSPQQYKNVLRSNGMNNTYFKQLMGNDMLMEQLNSGMASSNFVTEKELKETAKVVGQKRSFRYFVLPQEKIAETIEIAEADAKAYYDKNIDEFQTENRVKLDYIEVKQRDYFEPVAEDKLTEAYELEMAGFKAEKERRASHILIEVTDQKDQAQAKEEILALAKRIKEGEDFGSLAKEFSEDSISAENAGDLGFSKGDAFPEPFEKALFALELNAVSEPVLTDSGYHLIRATEIISGDEKPSYKERKPILEQRLQLAAAEVKFVASVEQLRDLVFNSEDLSDPATDLNLTVEKSEWITRTSRDSVLGNSKVLAAAFSDDVLEGGNNSEVIELASDHFIVVRVAKHEPPRAKEFATIKDSVVKILTKERASAKVVEIAQEAVSELSAGKLLEDIARGNDYEWQVELSVTRNSATAPRELLAAAFDMSVVPDGKMVIKTIPMNNGDAAVVQLEKVEDGSWDDFTAPQQKGIASELQRNAATKSMEGFVSTIRSNAEITIL